MENTIQQKSCHYCGKATRGRSDKKFCNDMCRNYFNNKNKEPVDERVRSINRILMKNRTLLNNVLSAGLTITKIRAEKLIELGFVFKYYTHAITSKKGTRYFLCYDYGYLCFSDGWCLIFEEEQLPPY